MRLYAAVVFFVLPVGFAADVSRALQDATIKAPGDGQIRATRMTLTHKGRFAILNGFLENDSQHKWNHITLSAKPSDATGNLFAAARVSIYGFEPGATKAFAVNVSGKFDFDSMAFSMEYQGGSFDATYQYEMISPIHADSLSFADEKTGWVFVPMENSIGFALVNKSSSTISLNWNQISYIDGSGTAHKVVSSQTRYIEINTQKPPILVPPNSNIKDAMIPSDNITFAGGINIAPLFPPCPQCLQMTGAEFGVFIPLEIDGTRRDYSFRFRVKSVK